MPRPACWALYIHRCYFFDFRVLLLCFRAAGGRGRAVATSLLGLLLRLGGTSPSSSPSPFAERADDAEQSHVEQHRTDGTKQAPEVKRQQPGGSGGDGTDVEKEGAGEHGGWEEFGGDPGRLVAEYAARLLSVLVSLSKARSYVLGEVRGSQFA